MLNRSIKDALAAEEKFFRSRPVCHCSFPAKCSVACGGSSIEFFYDFL